MKLYIFLDEKGDVIEELRAENHDQAVKRANNWIDSRPNGNKTVVEWSTDFYSEEIEEEEEE